jgi:hypothetical protein
MVMGHALAGMEPSSAQAAPPPPNPPPPNPHPRHTSRFIIVYLTFLPFALWAHMRWLMPPTMLTLTFLVGGRA